MKNEYKYLDLNGMIKISEVLSSFDKNVNWIERLTNYLKKHKDINMIRKNNTYYGSFEVFCYYLQSSKSEVLDKVACELEVSREYLSYLKQQKEIKEYRTSGKYSDDIKAIYGYKSLDDMNNKIVKDFRECKSKDDTFKIIMKWITALNYMQKLNTTKTKITTIRNLVASDDKIDTKIKNYVSEFLILPSFIYESLNSETKRKVEKLSLDNSSLIELNSKNVSDLIKRLNKELQSDLKAYDLSTIDNIRVDLIANRTLTKVTTKLSLILGLSTGRRLSELLVNGEFKTTTKKANEILERVNFMGVAKKRGENIGIYQIPIIELTANEVIFYSKILKTLVPDSIKKLIEDNKKLREVSNRFQIYVKRLWNNYSDYNISDMRDCRGAYALYCNLIDNNNRATTEAYIQSILLHDTKESASHYWTKFKMFK